ANRAGKQAHKAAQTIWVMKRSQLHSIQIPSGARNFNWKLPLLSSPPKATRLFLARGVSAPACPEPRRGRVLEGPGVIARHDTRRELPAVYLNRPYDFLTRISPDTVCTSTRAPPLPTRARRECLSCSSMIMGISALICPEVASADKWKL